MINGGFYLKARCIQNSEISTAPPHVREIWDWILKEANYKDTKICKRGQCVRTYSDILEGLKWFVGYRKMMYKKHQCENALKWLRKADMIATAKTTRGIVITVCNYDKYQIPANYDCYTKVDTKATMMLQPPATINNNEKKDNNEKNDKDYTVDFESFWNTYQKKGNKKKSFIQWKKLKPEQIVELNKKVEAYVSSTPDIQYRKNAETWLNPKNEHWNDELVQQKPKFEQTSINFNNNEQFNFKD